MIMHKLDEIDKEILNILSSNSRISIKKLAEIIHLSSPAVSNRIERLEDEGFILGYSTIVDYEKLDRPIVAFIQLTLEPESKTDFIDYISSVNDVLECYHVAGPYSMLIKACFSLPSKLNEFVGALQKYGKTETQIVFSCIVPQRNPKLNY